MISDVWNKANCLSLCPISDTVHCQDISNGIFSGLIWRATFTSLNCNASKPYNCLRKSLTGILAYLKATWHLLTSLRFLSIVPLFSFTCRKMSSFTQWRQKFSFLTQIMAMEYHSVLGSKKTYVEIWGGWHPWPFPPQHCRHPRKKPLSLCPRGSEDLSGMHLLASLLNPLALSAHLQFPSTCLDPALLTAVRCTQWAFEISEALIFGL